MIKRDDSLKLSFELPDRLLQEQLDIYETKMGEYINEYKAPFMSTAKFNAIAYTAAIDAGIISAWVCDLMPDLQPDSVNKADALVIKRVGEIIQDYMKPYTTISPS